MGNFVDIYIRLIIAVLSFVAPLIAYLLSVFSDGIAVVKQKAEVERAQIHSIIISTATKKTMDSQLIKKSLRAFEKTDNKTSKNLNLLNPQRQIKRIFGTLLVSLFFVMIAALCNDKSLFTFNKIVSVSLIAASVLTFATGLMILKQITWATIRTKQDMAGEKSKVVIKNQ